MRKGWSRRMLVLCGAAALLVPAAAGTATSAPPSWSVAKAEATIKRYGVTWSRWGRHTVTSVRCRGVGPAVRRSRPARYRHFSCYVKTKETCPYYMDVHVSGARSFRAEFARSETPATPRPTGSPTNEETFTDVTGDAQGGPDIATVALETYGDGMLRVRVVLANRIELAPGESVQLSVNPTEQRATAGGGFLLAAFPGRIELARWEADKFVFACGVSGTTAQSVVTLQLPLERLGRPAGFNLAVKSYAENGAKVADVAPNTTFWNFQTDRAPARSASFSDPGDDSGAGPDITNVDVSSFRGGLLVFRISVPNRWELGPGESVQLFVDVDQNRETGSSVGNEYVLAVGAARSMLGRWNGTAWVNVRTLADSSHSTGITRIKINAAELEARTAFNFAIQAFQDSRTLDRAPDRGSWTFERGTG